MSGTGPGFLAGEAFLSGTFAHRVSASTRRTVSVPPPGGMTRWITLMGEPKRVKKGGAERFGRVKRDWQKNYRQKMKNEGVRSSWG